MRASIAAMQQHLNDAKRVYAEEKELREAVHQQHPAHHEG